MTTFPSGFIYLLGYLAFFLLNWVSESIPQGLASKLCAAARFLPAAVLAILDAGRYHALPEKQRPKRTLPSRHLLDMHPYLRAVGYTALEFFFIWYAFRA